MSKTLVKIALVELHKLKEHEEVDPELFRKLFQEIVRDGFLKKPILVERKHFIILDGHHRYNVLKKLGAKAIPVVLVDYDDGKIVLDTWRKEIRVSKQDVVKMALNGKKFPPKTTKHVVSFPIPEVNIPLSKLGVRMVTKDETGR